MGLLDFISPLGAVNAQGSQVTGDPNLLGDMATGGAISNNQAITQTNAQNIAYAQQQENFQATMSNTAYQRAVADMTKAGLNPMLAYSQGGASVPTGTTPQLQAPKPGDIGAGLFNNAKALVTGSADLAKTQSDTALNQHQSDLTDSKRDQADAQTAGEYQSIDESKQRTKKLQAETTKAQHDARKAKNDADISDASVSTDKSLAPWQSIFGAISQALNIGSNAKAFASSVKQSRAESVLKKYRGVPTSGYTSQGYNK